MRVFAVLRALVFVSAVAAPSLLYAQFQQPTDEELKMTADPKAPGADAVYLYREEANDDYNNFHSYYERIKILTEKGKDWQSQAQQLVRELAEASRSGGAAFASRPWIREILRCLQRPWSHHSSLFLPRLTLRRWT